MDGIFHLEAMPRQVSASTSIGHTAPVYYGEKHIEIDQDFYVEEEDLETPEDAICVQLGCPLTPAPKTFDRAPLPLMRSVGFSPDFSQDKGFLFTETVHYVKDKRFLIPIRTKVRNGRGTHLRLSHLPSLNLARNDIAGHSPTVINPASDIVSDLLMHDTALVKHNKAPLGDWISNDLVHRLDAEPVCALGHDDKLVSQMVYNYKEAVSRIPYMVDQRNLQSVSQVLLPPRSLIPPPLFSAEPIVKNAYMLKDHWTPTQVDFKSWGSIDTSQVPNMAYDPVGFSSLTEVLDEIPLTDFNVDVIVGTDGEVVHWETHLAVDRFSSFIDNEMRLYDPQEVLQVYLDGSVIELVFACFVQNHPYITHAIQDILIHEQVKIRFIKTMCDEAAILLYRAKTQKGELPLCGVKFDFAVQSLAPMSVVRNPNGV